MGNINQNQKIMEFIRKFNCALTGTEVHIYRTQEGEEIALSPALGELEVNKDEEEIEANGELEVYEDEEEIDAICIEYLLC